MHMKKAMITTENWQVEFDNRFLAQSHMKDKAGNTSIHSVEKINIKAYITNLLAAKDREIVEAYAQGWNEGQQALSAK